jgi:hypothetical protein
MHGHGLFKIQLAVHRRGPTSHLQQYDITINKSKKRKVTRGDKGHEITIWPQHGEGSKSFTIARKWAKKSWELVQTRDSYQVFQEMWDQQCLCRKCIYSEESGSSYHNTLKPGYNDNGLYDTSPIASDIPAVPINSSLLTITLHSPVITTSVYTTPRL